MTFIKFCGMTREDDVRAACDLGVSAVGFVMWPGSPRYVAPERTAALVAATSAAVLPVGVLVSPSVTDLSAARDAGIRTFQIHGEPAALADESLAIWRATSLETEVNVIDPHTLIVLDAHDPVRHGGTGRTINWTRAAQVAAARRILLAGGLNPANVGEAIRQVRPFGVDVASGIEQRPGIKDAQAMQAFVAAVREAEA